MIYFAKKCHRPQPKTDFGAMLQVSTTKWQEVDKLEEFFKELTEMTMDERANMSSEEAAYRDRQNLGERWTELPVENAHIFIKRFTEFKKHFLNEKNILGKVNQEVVRWEVQGRGSLHTHVLLWIDGNDVESVAAQISAAMPAEWDASKQEWIEPEDSNQKKLFHLVKDKMMHTCRRTSCRQKHEDGICQLGFPRPIQKQKGCTLNAKGIWEYWRPREQDRYIVPYHPALLLLWGAHVNILRVSNAQFSHYLLKYAMKAEPAGRLNLEKLENAQALGLDHLSDVARKAFTAQYMSRPVSSAEAVMSLMKLDPVNCPKVVPVSTFTPNNRQASADSACSIFAWKALLHTLACKHLIPCICWCL